MLWRVGTLWVACACMVPGEAAAEAPLEGTRSEIRGTSGGDGDGQLQGVRDQTRGTSGTLDDVRGAMEGGTRSGRRSPRASSSGSSAGTGAAAAEAIGGVLELIGAFAEAAHRDKPSRGPRRARTVGPEEPHHPPGFLRFPYADGRPGYIVDDRPESERRTFGFSARLGGGFAFGGVYQGNFAAEMQAWRIVVGSELATYVEPPSPASATDAMMFGSTSLRAAIIMAPFIRVRVGGGAQYGFDGLTAGRGPPSTALGWELSADADVFAVRPMVFSFSVDKGQLAGADTTKARASVGAMLGRFELYADYNLRRIGAVNLHGPGLGLRTWF